MYGDLLLVLLLGLFDVCGVAAGFPVDFGAEALFDGVGTAHEPAFGGHGLGEVVVGFPDESEGVAHVFVVEVELDVFEVVEDGTVLFGDLTSCSFVQG